MKLKHFGFNRGGGGVDDAIDCNGFGLAHAIGACGGLVFYGGIPPWIGDDDVIGSSDIEAGAARFKADEEGVVGACLEGVYDVFAFMRGSSSVEIEAGDIVGEEVLFDEVEEVGELTKYESAMAICFQVGDELGDGEHFSAGEGARGVE